jgi:hypothetical protein
MTKVSDIRIALKYISKANSVVYQTTASVTKKKGYTMLNLGG